MLLCLCVDCTNMMMGHISDFFYHWRVLEIEVLPSRHTAISDIHRIHEFMWEEAGLSVT